MKGATLTANPGNLGFSDPFPGRHKSFIIVYREGGRVRVSLTPQEDAARLGSVPAKP